MIPLSTRIAKGIFSCTLLPPVTVGLAKTCLFVELSGSTSPLFPILLTCVCVCSFITAWSLFEKSYWDWELQNPFYCFFCSLTFTVRVLTNVKSRQLDLVPFPGLDHGWWCCFSRLLSELLLVFHSRCTCCILTFKFTFFSVLKNSV